MGDPGVAKSQLLGYIDRIAPRSITIVLLSQTLQLTFIRSVHYWPGKLWGWLDSCSYERSCNRRNDIRYIIFHCIISLLCIRL